MNRLIVLLLVMLFYGMPSQVIAIPSFTITDLGTLGGNESNARGINNSGQIVGYSKTNSNLGHAFLWDRGSMVDLGTLGGDTSYATDINDFGQIAGTSFRQIGPIHTPHAFLWENGSMTDLGTLNGISESYSMAEGINNYGQIVGSSQSVFGPTHAFLWENGSMTDLGTLGTNRDSSSASDINNAGQVVGSSQDTSGFAHPFLWENGAMTDLGSLEDNGDYATAINSSSKVVGSSFFGAYYQAFFWENGVMTDLGSDTFEAQSISDLGQIVGASRTFAFLWENGSVFDLNDLILSDSDWQLTRAEDINQFGQIVGSGMINGEQHAFLLTPESAPVPEPATILLFSSGIVGLIGFRRKFKK
jgi:probable HAF family extracellular repeat protein